MNANEKKDLVLAVLAMDAYNQGYDAPINSASQIGNYLVGTDSSVLRDSENNRLDIPSSFFATSYSSGNEIIISYRGTDDPSTDVLTGWTTILGYPGQSDLATQFYHEVKKANPGKKIVLTGHS